MVLCTALASLLLSMFLTNYYCFLPHIISSAHFLSDFLVHIFSSLGDVAIKIPHYCLKANSPKFNLWSLSYHQKQMALLQIPNFYLCRAQILPRHRLFQGTDSSAQAQNPGDNVASSLSFPLNWTPVANFYQCLLFALCSHCHPEWVDSGTHPGMHHTLAVPC